MTEEIQNTNAEPQVEESQIEDGQSSDTPELSEVEQRAIEMGWKPKSQFSGDEADFIDAKEFVSRKPLFDRIEHQSRELKEVRKALKALSDHHQKVKETEYKAALEELKQEKRRALESGDADKLIEIDDRIAEEKARQVVSEREDKTQTNQPHPEFVNWVKQNTWYANDAEMRISADQIGTAYAAAHPELDPNEVLKYVKERIRKVYPEKFQNPNKERPSAVEGSSNAPTRSSRSRDDFVLTDEERRVMNTFVRTGVMTAEEYKAELRKVRSA